MEQKTRSVNPLSSKREKNLELRTCGWVDDNGGGQEMVEPMTIMEDYRGKNTQVEMVMSSVDKREKPVMGSTSEGRSRWWVVPKVEPVIGRIEGSWCVEFWREYWESMRVKEIGRVSGLRECTKCKMFYQYFKRKIFYTNLPWLFWFIENILPLTKYFTTK